MGSRLYLVCFLTLMDSISSNSTVLQLAEKGFIYRRAGFWRVEWAERLMHGLNLISHDGMGGQFGTWATSLQPDDPDYWRQSHFFVSAPF